LPSGDRCDEYILGSLIAITVAAMSGVAVTEGVAISVGLGVKVAVIASGVGVVACNVAVSEGTDGSCVARGRQLLISQMHMRTKRSEFRFIDLLLSGRCLPN
jgi:hypothetical protein